MRSTPSAVKLSARTRCGIAVSRDLTRARSEKPTAQAGDQRDDLALFRCAQHLGGGSAIGADTPATAKQAAAKEAGDHHHDAIEILTKHSEWKNVFAFDEFAGKKISTEVICTAQGVRTLNF